MGEIGKVALWTDRSTNRPSQSCTEVRELKIKDCLRALTTRSRCDFSQGIYSVPEPQPVGFQRAAIPREHREDADLMGNHED